MLTFKIKRSFGSVFVMLIAVMLIAFGLLHISLGFFGEEDTALITHIRRQGGERNEAIPNRYTYSISYTFTTAEGEKIDGFTYKIGSPVYIKISDSSNVTAPVRYFKIQPRLNALDRDAGLNWGNIILILAGAIILKLLLPRKHKHKLRKQNYIKKAAR